MHVGVPPSHAASIASGSFGDYGYEALSEMSHEAGYDVETDQHVKLLQGNGDESTLAVLPANPEIVRYFKDVADCMSQFNSTSALVLDKLYGPEDEALLSVTVVLQRQVPALVIECELWFCCVVSLGILQASFFVSLLCRLNISQNPSLTELNCCFQLLHFLAADLASVLRDNTHITRLIISHQYRAVPDNIGMRRKHQCPHGAEVLDQHCAVSLD